MIDFNWTSLTFNLALLFFVLFILYIVMYYKKCVTCPNWQQTKGSFCLLLFSLLLIIVVANGNGSDWFSYQGMVWEYSFLEGAINYGEPIYWYIIKFVNRNYLLFRLVVWGGAFLVTCLSFRRFNVNVNVAVFALVSMYLCTFNYARATLGMACYFGGLSFVLKPLKKNKLINLLLIVLLFIGAYSFHHSMLTLLVFTIVVLLPVERPVILVGLIVLLPVIASLISSNFNYIDRFGDEYLSNKVAGGVAHVGEAANVYGMITNVINYGSFFLPLVVFSVALFKHHKKIEKSIIRLYRITLCVSFFAISFLFMGMNSLLLFYRHLYMTMIPLIILCTYFYEYQLLSRRWFSIIVIWGIVSQGFSLLYNLYSLS